MADVQMEKGFTRIANELLLALAGARLAGVEASVVLWVLRETYGWNRKEAPFSLRRMAKKCGRQRSGLRDAVRNLAGRGIVKVEGKSIGIVKDFDRWAPPGATAPGSHSAMALQPPKGGATAPGPFHRKEIKTLPILAGFDDFWKAYPRKVAKQDALLAWGKLKPGPELVAQIVAAVATHARTDQWTKGGGQFVPYPASWLNGRRWEDALPSSPPEQQAAATMDQARQNTANLIARRHRQSGASNGDSI